MNFQSQRDLVAASLGATHHPDVYGRRPSSRSREQCAADGTPARETAAAECLVTHDAGAEERAAATPELPRRSPCGFCHGQPVTNAATWIDGKPRPAAACPRCGETNQPTPRAIPGTNGRRTC